MKAFRILYQMVANWLDDHAPTYSAAIAFYTIFSFIPLVLLALGVAGFVFGQEQANREVRHELQMYIGHEASESLGNMALTAGQSGQSGWAVAVGAVALFLGAAAVFGQIQVALNRIWKAQSVGSFGRQMWDFVRRKLLTFAMVMLFGLMFLVLMALTSFGPAIRRMFPDAVTPRAVDFYIGYRSFLSLIVVALLLAMMYKILPDAKIRWKDVWIGSLATSGAMLVGELLISLYLRHASVASAYGAAGSLAILLVWVYYSAMVFLMGAEFTHVYALQRGYKNNDAQPPEKVE